MKQLKLLAVTVHIWNSWNMLSSFEELTHLPTFISTCHAKKSHARAENSQFYVNMSKKRVRK